MHTCTLTHTEDNKIKAKESIDAPHILTKGKYFLSHVHTHAVGFTTTTCMHTFTATEEQEEGPIYTRF